MRFFLFLAAALVAALYGQQVKEKVGVSYKLPNGLPNGAVITFFVWHLKGETSWFRAPYANPVSINFYDQPVINYTKGADGYDGHSDISAHLRLDRSWYYPVESNTLVNGVWRTATKKEQPTDWLAPSRGYWRLDVIKLDSYRMNVFFEGFWSDVRTFEKPLDNLRSVYVVSDFVDYDHVEIRVNLPNSHIVPHSYDQFKDWIDNDDKKFDLHRKLTTLPNFPIGSQMKIIAMLRSSAGSGWKRFVTLFFKPSGSDQFFMRIFQHWTSTWVWQSLQNFYTHELFMNHGDEWATAKGDRKPCTSLETRPNGDVVHFILTRTSKQVVKMELLYKPIPPPNEAFSPTSITCELTIPSDKAVWMDGPIDIMSFDGALIFHLEQTIPSG